LLIFTEEYICMVHVYENFSLRNNHTFGVDIASRYYSNPSSVEELEQILNHAKSHQWSYSIIGEGSNLLITDPYPGLLIHPQLKGIKLVDESETEVLVQAGAGENWDNFVAYCVRKNWYGTENLSLIPGSVGAAPVQNIGAYGAEVKEIIEFVEVFDTNDSDSRVLSNASCEFAYRDSIFKHGSKNRFIVCSVVFRLKKQGVLQLDYGNVKEEFLKQNSHDLVDLRNTIISIRNRKLPDPEVTGNAGSFFKNPLISRNAYEILSQDHTGVPGYPNGKNLVKIPAAWLIEKAGWKGVREGDVGTWPHQPLVIVNYGKASGTEIFLFSEKIKNAVSEKFGIELEREVTLVQ